MIQTTQNRAPVSIFQSPDQNALESTMSAFIGGGEKCKLCQTKKEDETFVSPCNCKKNLKYSHLSCMKNYVLKEILKVKGENRDQILDKKQVQCQFCRSFISFDYEEKQSCVNCQKFKQNISERGCGVNLLMFFLLVLFPGLIGLCSSFINQNEEMRITAIVLISLFSVCLVIVIIVIVKMYLVRTEYTILTIDKGKVKILPSFILNQVLRTTSKGSSKITSSES